MSIGWLGKKYDDLQRKNANIRGKRSKQGEEGQILTVLVGEKCHFGNRGGGGQNINCLDIIHPCMAF